MTTEPTTKPPVEALVLAEFSKKSLHLRDKPATRAMQYQLLEIATPYHAKLKELGYPPEMSKAMLRKAFDHQPPLTARTLFSTQKLVTIFD